MTTRDIPNDYAARIRALRLNLGLSQAEPPSTDVVSGLNQLLHEVSKGLTLQ